MQEILFHLVWQNKLEVLIYKIINKILTLKMKLKGG